MNVKRVIFLAFILFTSTQTFSQTQISVGAQVNFFTSQIRGYYFTAPANFQTSSHPRTCLWEQVRALRSLLSPPLVWAVLIAPLLL